MLKGITRRTKHENSSSCAPAAPEPPGLVM
nr:MAG TPA: hypothetical protein [Caudoviricetes sp.]